MAAEGKTPMENFDDALSKLLEVNKQRLDEALGKSDVSEQEPEPDFDR